MDHYTDVKVTSQVKMGIPNFLVSPPKTSTIKMKFDTADYVGEGNTHNPLFVTIGLLRASLHMGEI